jgi:hypothetical protein
MKRTAMWTRGTAMWTRGQCVEGAAYEQEGSSVNKRERCEQEEGGIHVNKRRQRWEGSVHNDKREQQCERQQCEQEGTARYVWTKQCCEQEEETAMWRGAAMWARGEQLCLIMKRTANNEQEENSTVMRTAIMENEWCERGSDENKKGATLIGSGAMWNKNSKKGSNDVKQENNTNELRDSKCEREQRCETRGTW